LTLKADPYSKLNQNLVAKEKGKNGLDILR
jgi:hypothetical protein